MQPLVVLEAKQTARIQRGAASQSLLRYLLPIQVASSLSTSHGHAEVLKEALYLQVPAVAMGDGRPDVDSMLRDVGRKPFQSPAAQLLENIAKAYQPVT